MFNFLPWRRRKENRVDYIGNEKDRDKILEMLANLDDQSSISVGKRVYSINDRELVAKKNELFRNRTKWKNNRTLNK